MGQIRGVVTLHVKIKELGPLKHNMHTLLKLNSYPAIEFLGNSLTQTKPTKQTKQMFIRLYYLEYWIQIIQSDELQVLISTLLDGLALLCCVASHNMPWGNCCESYPGLYRVLPSITVIYNYNTCVVIKSLLVT